MSGLFGARSPSLLFNLLAGKRKTGNEGRAPGQGASITPGQATPTSRPVTPPRAKARAVKNGEPRKPLRVPYG
jgi:hypothetical protein